MIDRATSKKFPEKTKAASEKWKMSYETSME